MGQIIRIENAFQKYPNKDHSLKVILNNITLNIKEGELTTLVGPSGCGKSTMLRLILGSERPYEGKAFMEENEIIEPDRTRGVVFQKYSLFNGYNVRDNVAFGLIVEEFNIPFEKWFSPIRYKRKVKEFNKRADMFLDSVGLLDSADKFPYELSGGMRQRVAIAQALIMKPKVLLMDEPFGALDVGTREAMQTLTLEYWQREKNTILFVTHDLDEALYLGSRLIVLSQYYSDLGTKGIGAKIVKDIKIPWGKKINPTEIKFSEEFVRLKEEIYHEGMDKKNLQEINTFDLSHQDAHKI